MKLLMVEGKDDEHVIKHICGLRQLGKIETIYPCNGKDELIKQIEVQVKGSEIDVLGIILDADTNLQDCWQAISSRLITAGYANIPAIPDREGTIIESQIDSLLPKVGVWLMPDNQVSGILEDFLRFLVPEQDDLFAYVEQSICKIPPEHLRFSSLKSPKALIHTWLAWQEELGKPLGQAISARYLDPNLPAVDIFASWLQRLFFT